jgi:uncharacterized membrane protein YecN with MAPEG domain
MQTIIAAVITGGISLVGVIITSIVTVIVNSKKTEKVSADVTKALEISQAVTDTKIEELTREVRAHNNFAQRVPVLEEKMTVANHRIDDLEEANKHGRNQ